MVSEILNRYVVTSDAVDVIEILKPVYNFKAVEEKPGFLK